MWRGPVVQQRKNVVNAAKGKVFSIHAKLIMLAAQSGGNPDDNPTLSTAIHKAKKDWVPNENIERSIKKGTGEDKDWVQISEIIYEWYAPGWAAVIVVTLTDNKNRTVANMRHAFSKYSGNMGESGSVSWNFDRRGVLRIAQEWVDDDSLEEAIFETEALDFTTEWDSFKIITEITDVKKVEDFLISKWFEIQKSWVEHVPQTMSEITDFDIALKIIKMLEAFDEDEDVQDVFINADIDDELQAKVLDFIEKNTFKT